VDDARQYSFANVLGDCHPDADAVSSSEWRKTVRVSFLATWRQEKGASAIPTLRQEPVWLDPLAGGHAMVPHTNLEGISLADGQPVDGNCFIHNVR